MAQGYGYRSEQRLRKENQDTFGVFELDACTLLVVCDGMGGHVGGRQASSIAVRTIHDEMAAYGGGDVRGALRRAIEAANRAIYETARKNYRLMGMGTTCVAAAVVGNTAHIAHVGDSRCYLLRDGRGATALTRDHTMVNLFVDAELLSPEDAATHPEAHVLSRSLGVERQVEVDLSEPVTLQQGDRLVLCSDGVHGVIGATGLAAADWRNPQEGTDACLAAVERAEGDDNATLVAFGQGIAGASSPPTTPPDISNLEAEGRATAAPQPALTPARRPTLVPGSAPVEPDPSAPIVVSAPSTGSFETSGPQPIRYGVQDAPTLAEATDDELAPPPPTPARKPRAKRGASKGIPRNLLLGGAVVAGLAVVLVAVLLSGGSSDAPAAAREQVATAAPEPLPVEAPATLDADPAAAPIVPTDATLLVANVGTRGMYRARCLDCTSTFGLPSSGAYLSGASDPEVAVAFFAPEVPPAPRRVPNTTSVYDHPAPSGPDQTKAVRAARNKKCREALDTVRDAIRKSIDYASLYAAAWYCFNDTHTASLTRARAATWQDFRPLLEHFEGDRSVPVSAFAGLVPEPAPVEEVAADDATAEGEGEDEVVTDTDPDDAPVPDLPDVWSIPAAGGVEYRLALYEIDDDVQGFREIMVDLLGEPTVADHLATDVLLEATAAAAVARMDRPPPDALQAWARRVYVASRAMTGPVGELIRAHRKEVAGMIEALLFEATGGDEGLQAIQEGYPNDAVPPVVARAQAAGLAGEMPDLFGNEGSLSSLDSLAAVERELMTEETWSDPPVVAGTTRGGASRRSYPRPTRSRRDADLQVDAAEFDWESFGFLKVWYPRQRMPRVLRPYQQDVGELPVDASMRMSDEDISVYRRGEVLDPDWSQ